MNKSDSAFAVEVTLYLCIIAFLSGFLFALQLPKECEFTLTDRVGVRHTFQGECL